MAKLPRITRAHDEENAQGARSRLQGEVALAAINAEKTLAEFGKAVCAHPHQITARKAQLQEGAACVFRAGAVATEAPPAVDPKLLQRRSASGRWRRCSPVKAVVRSTSPSFATVRFHADREFRSACRRHGSAA